VCFELRFQFIFGQSSVLDFRSFGWGLRDGPSREAKLDFLPTLVISDIRRWDTLHAEDLDFIAITTG
jgi:hypothetical protein